MNKQVGVSSLLAAAASFLLVGMVAVGSASSASAASEEDLAAPHGSFVSTLPVPAKIQNVAPRVPANGVQYVAQAGSEEDLAAPHGSFVSTLAIPGERNVRVGALSEDDAADYDDIGKATFNERIAALLE